MIRLGKLTDYGLVLMTYMARNHERPLHTARDLALESRLAMPLWWWRPERLLPMSCFRRARKDSARNLWPSQK